MGITVGGGKPVGSKLGTFVAGKYRLLKLLGKGGMGEVYEAVSIRTEERVAVKLHEIRRDVHDGHRRTRFRREAVAAAAIKSDHVARILDSGEDDVRGTSYIVMELLEGQDLETLLQRISCLKPQTALRIAAQVCAGLVEAHRARIIHRDIKPANLFLVRRPGGEIVVKILDFGIAKTKAEPGENTTGLTRSGSTIGTPLYMSPEQARGLKEIGYSTDLWSIGVVLYRCLTGRVPHHGIDAHGDLIIAISTKLTPPIQRFAPWVPPEIAAVVHRALRLNAESRFSSAQAMLEAIDALVPYGRRLDESMLVAPTLEELAVKQAEHDEPMADMGRHADSIVDEMQSRRGTTVEHLVADAEQRENGNEFLAPSNVATDEEPRNRRLEASNWRRRVFRTTFAVLAMFMSFVAMVVAARSRGMEGRTGASNLPAPATSVSSIASAVNRPLATGPSIAGTGLLDEGQIEGANVHSPSAPVTAVPTPSSAVKRPNFTDSSTRELRATAPANSANGQNLEPATVSNSKPPALPEGLNAEME